MMSVPKGTETKRQREQLGTGLEHLQPLEFAVPWGLPALIVVVYIYLLCAGGGGVEVPPLECGCRVVV